MLTGRCSHGLTESTCYICRTVRENRGKRVPKPRREKTVHGAATIPSTWMAHKGYAVVRARRQCSREFLGPWVKFVHIDGHPFLWLIKEVIERCENLETIQVIPPMLRKMKGKLKVCEERGVRVVTGHHKPQSAWNEERVVNPYYDEQRAFMRGLQEEQKRLFDELLTLGVEYAEWAKRYYALENEEFTPQTRLAEEYGLTNIVVSRNILGVLRYLDPSFKCGIDSVNKAKGIERKVKRLRKVMEDRAAFEEWLVRLGVPALPEGLLYARAEVYAAVYKKWNAGELVLGEDRLEEILTRRFGLLTNRCETLQEISADFKVCSERVRQLELRALKALNIVED